jgi:4-hydroxy-4-methyl-2-oxoglutarate aldolase
MKTILVALMVFTGTIFASLGLNAQYDRIAMDREYIISLTRNWEGERLPDGRPYVSDDLLERLKSIVFTHAWGELRRHGFNNQWQGDWMMINADKNPVMTGRVVTAQYMPLRPDWGDMIREIGLAAGYESVGPTNVWPINLLVDGDVYVADGYGKIENGTLIGDRLANSIYHKSNRGVIFWAAVRNIQEIENIEGFSGWIKGHDPSGIAQMMLTSINAPIRIGQVTVLPGDIVLASKYGTIFLPAYLVQETVFNAEISNLRHVYGIIRLRAGDWGTGQIDSRWTDQMDKDFYNWLRNLPDSELPMPRAELNEYLKGRL